MSSAMVGASPHLRGVKWGVNTNWWAFSPIFPFSRSVGAAELALAQAVGVLGIALSWQIWLPLIDSLAPWRRGEALFIPVCIPSSLFKSNLPLLKHEKKNKNPVFKSRDGNWFTFHSGRMAVNDVECSGFSTSATLLYLRMLLFRFQNKQPLILARGVFDKQALGIIHHSLGKHSSCLCIYSSAYICINEGKNLFLKHVTSKPEALWEAQVV